MSNVTNEILAQILDEARFFYDRFPVARLQVLRPQSRREITISTGA